MNHQPRLDNNDSSSQSVSFAYLTPESVFMQIKQLHHTVLLTVLITICSNQRILSQESHQTRIESLLDIANNAPDSVILIVDNLFISEEFEHDSSYYYGLRKVKAKALFKKGFFEKCLLYYKSNYTYYNKTNDSLSLAKAADQIGTSYMYQGNIESAQPYFIEALNLFEKVGSPKDLANMYNGFAGLHSFLGDNEKSLDYLQKAMNLYIEMKDTSGQSQLHSNMGFVHMDMENYKEAEINFKKQYILDSLIGSKTGVGFFHDYMGDLNKRQGKYQLAIDHYNQAINIREELSNSFDLSESKLSIAEALIEMKKYNRAISYLKEELKERENYGSVLHVREIYKLISLSYKKQGLYAQSLEYHEKLKVVSDSLFNAEMLDAFAEKDAKYELDKKEAKLITLELEDQLKETRITNQKYTISGLGIGLGLVSLLGYFLYNQKNKISKQNLIISKSALEKDILLREIHHRVKNNLQVVSSLLGIQGREIKDQKAQDAIQEGRNRVQSMSLIHQNLYKKDNLTGIEMRPYINKLSNHLLNTYQVESGEIKIETQVDDITLDVETVVPIGLIINELISNSLKYAFPNDANGVISIELHESKYQLILSISDDGIGLNPDQLQTKTETFGHSLIRAFKTKLDADISIQSEGGTRIELKIRNYKKIKE